MKRLLVIGLAVSSLALQACSPAEASPRTTRSMAAQVLAGVSPPSEFSLFLLLNGQPTKLGVLTSTGTSVTNASTAVPFTLTTTDCVSRVFLFMCDAGQANVGAGSTCETVITNASHRFQVNSAFSPYYMISTGTTFCLDAPAATTINCAVFCMQ